MEGALEFEPRVTPLELFFDLVFVFAFTQVTSLMSADATAGGVLRGMLVLAALWWAWIVIIALGESIVAIGVGASGHPAGRRRRRGGTAGRGHRRIALVGLLRLGRDRRREQARLGNGRCAGCARPGRVLLPAPAEGRRHRPLRARPEEGACG